MTTQLPVIAFEARHPIQFTLGACPVVEYVPKGRNARRRKPPLFGMNRYVITRQAGQEPREMPAIRQFFTELFTVAFGRLPRKVVVQHVHETETRSEGNAVSRLYGWEVELCWCSDPGARYFGVNVSRVNLPSMKGRSMSQHFDVKDIKDVVVTAFGLLYLWNWEEP